MRKRSRTPAEAAGWQPFRQIRKHPQTDFRDFGSVVLEFSMSPGLRTLIGGH
jgi:hypothetical protein